MTNLVDAIRVLHPVAKFGTPHQGGDFCVVTDPVSGAQSVTYWNTDTLGAEPDMATLEAVVVPAPVRTASVKQLVQAMNTSGTLAAFSAGKAIAKATDQERWASYDLVPEDNPVLGRIAAKATPAIVVSALYDAALG